MADYQITCVDKADQGDPHTRIRKLGGPHLGVIAAEDMITRIKNGQDTFYTLVDGERANIEVAMRGHVEYLKTERDKEIPNNLLSLSPCKQDEHPDPDRKRKYA